MHVWCHVIWWKVILALKPFSCSPSGICKFFASFNLASCCCASLCQSLCIMLYLRVYLHDTQNKTSTCNEKKSVHISFHWGQNKISLFSFDLLIYYLSFYEIFAWTDPSFLMVSFQVSVYVTFTTRNEISLLSKWSELKNTHNEFHFRIIM